MTPYFIVAIVVLGAFLAFDLVRRGKARKHVDDLYEQGRTEELVEYLDGSKARRIFPAYNRLYTKFNAYQKAGDAAAASETLKELLALDSSDEQRSDLLPRAFQFLLKNGDHENAEKVLDELERREPDRTLADECRKVYDIVAKGSTVYIKEMEDQLKQADLLGDGPTAQRLHYLLSLQYASENDAEASTRHRELSLK